MPTRCDLHLHSSASNQSEQWFPRHFDCPESYADPKVQYELCRARGMSLVTLTDHDTIDGGLILLGRPDFFLSEEVTARFPDSGCTVHVLAWNITPDDHQEIQRVRNDVYALVELLRERRIAHGLAHPLESPNGKLDAATLERLALLFSTFEVINGRTEERLNSGIRALLAELDAPALRRLSLRHSLPPARGLTRRQAVSAGSDDHEHPRAGSCFTEVEGALAPAAFLRAVMAGDGRPVGRGADVIGLGVGFASTTYRFLEARARAGQRLESPFADVMDALGGRFEPGPEASSGRREFMAHVRDIVGEVRPPDARQDLSRIGLDADADEVAAAEIRVCDALVAHGAAAALAAVMNADFFGLFSAVRNVAAGIKGIVPFLFAAQHLGRQVRDLATLRKGWSLTRWPDAPARLAIFTDTLGQVDGVSMWVRRFLEQAARAGDGTDVLVPHCGPVSAVIRDARNERFFVELPETTGGELPAYKGLRLAVPSFVHTLAWLQRAGVTRVEIATPGPFGLCGLLAAKMLGIPARATYHTEVPDLVRLLTSSERLQGWATTYLRWFYAQVEAVTVFSVGAQQRVRGLGVPDSRIDLRTLAVDPDEFSPKYADAGGDDALDLPRDRPIVLSVGRLSAEKNLPVVIEALSRMQRRDLNPLLVIVGDGPERTRLEAVTAGRSDVRFLGERSGIALRRIYARAAAFVFASEIDTLGLVAMEAMSSGVPLIAAENASIADLVEHRRSAYLCAPDALGFASALDEVLVNRGLAGTLAHNGRARMIRRWQESHGQSARAAPARG